MLSSLYYDATKNSLNLGSLDISRSVKFNSVRKVDGSESNISVVESPEYTVSNRRPIKADTSAQSRVYHEELKILSPVVQSSLSVLREEKTHPVEADKPVKLKKFSSLTAKRDCSQINEALNDVLGEIPSPDVSIGSGVLVEKREQFLSALFGRDCKLLLPPFFTKEYIAELVGPEYESFAEKYYYLLNKLKWRNYGM